jgi:cobyric acid synthase
MNITIHFNRTDVIPTMQCNADSPLHVDTHPLETKGEQNTIIVCEYFGTHYEINEECSDIACIEYK